MVRKYATDIAREIQRLILTDARFAPGETPPTPPQFAKEINADPRTVRDAYKLLGDAGLFIRDHHGLRVSLDAPLLITDTFFVRAPVSGPPPWSEVFRFRALFEGEVCRQAALHLPRSPNAREAFSHAHKQVNHAFAHRDAATAAAADQAFHDTIYQHCGSRMLLILARGVDSFVRTNIKGHVERLYPYRPYREDTINQHQRIYEAICHAKPHEASRAARAHMRYVGRLVKDFGIDFDHKPSPHR